MTALVGPHITHALPSSLTSSSRVGNTTPSARTTVNAISNGIRLCMTRGSLTAAVMSTNKWTAVMKTGNTHPKMLLGLR